MPPPKFLQSFAGKLGYCSKYNASSISDGSKKFIPLEIRGVTNLKVGEDRQISLNEKPFILHKRFRNAIDWTNIWPAAASFHHSVVPFQVRQGHCKNLSENEGIPPVKYANTELMKIPNFFHLTPLHIKKHCDALRKFCTLWPSSLDSNEMIEKHYPVNIINHSYVFTSSNIRDPRSRIVTLQIRLANLSLDEHAKRKLLRLAMGPGPGRNIASYNWNTDILELTSARCPTSKQNTDFLVYVLTVLTLESKKVEKWEIDNPEYDWLQFDWQRSESRRRLVNLLSKCNREEDKSNNQTKDEDMDKFESHPTVVQYREALKSIWSKNDVLNGDQWIKRPDPPKYRHSRLRPIRNVPFVTIPGADEQNNLEKYAAATRNLFGLGTGTQQSNM
ncbi:hypothetical protein MN116_008358 [Schistosoma mekongi]|uniref:Small ribosomal subunit protein mS35 mitochondrial conserved domain-containing protein n=1 Tax=Schistosoma mekongi TaxID=38744 RepID=A0AAE1Z7D4_SCHME|nr:hypothetical protein MN116_008358 [Schistosoma mekongi]